MTLRVAWLTTGRGPGSYGALEYTLKAVAEGLPVEIAVVFINRDRGEAEATDRLIAMVEAAGIPVETLSSVAFRKARGGKLSKAGEPLPAWRAEYDREVAELLGRHEFELGVMFGYMLIATEELYGRFTFINDHPASPEGPVGTYEEVIRELIRTAADDSGCLMNVVTGDLDRGPVVAFCTFPIRGDGIDAYWTMLAPEGGEDDELFAEIRRLGVKRERPFLVETLAAIEEGRAQVPPARRALDLTTEVELRIAADRASQMERV